MNAKRKSVQQPEKQFPQVSGVSQHTGINEAPVNEVPPIVYEALRSPGQPLDVETTALFEPRFGHDFSQVRVHTDAKAVESARAVDALAYAVGQEIVFDEGQYAPKTIDGRMLLAHELTHVLQQRTNLPDMSQIEVGASLCPEEREANTLADQATATSWMISPIHTELLSPVVIQREEGRNKPRKIRLPEQKIIMPPAYQLLSEADVGPIVSDLMLAWYSNSRIGLQNASLSGDDDGVKWFLIALGGNLVWAATAFINPAASLVIRTMSMSGAVIGTGTMEQLFREGSSNDFFREKVRDRLSETYERIMTNLQPVIDALMDELYNDGLSHRNESAEIEPRRKAAWRFIFNDTIGYNSPAELEKSSKYNIELLWGFFLKHWNPIKPMWWEKLSPPEVRRDPSMFALGCYHLAIQESGIDERLRLTK